MTGTEKEYLSVSEALALVLAMVSPLPMAEVALPEALGRVLADPVVARDNLPPFDNSAMDGYAVLAADVGLASPETPVVLSVVADIAAGVAPDIVLRPGTAARIMTGAPLPVGATAIVPVEDTSEPWRAESRPLPESIAIYRGVEAGAYIRPAGQDVQFGETVLRPGHILRPQEIGVLASLGVGRVPIVRPPRIGILSTGDELVDVDAPLTPGKIRNSNSYTQAAQVRSMGAVPILLGVAQDTEADVRAKLQAGVAAGVDLFVSTAGVSVGAYDVVRTVLERDGEMGFWRVRMRPGKPLAVGRYAGIPYLGLPGNPVSAAVSFERFVRPAILKMGGYTVLERPRVRVVVQDAFDSDGRESYIRVVVEPAGSGFTAKTTGHQGSNLLTSLVKANALLIVPEGVTKIRSGSELWAIMIDWPESVMLC